VVGVVNAKDKESKLSYVTFEYGSEINVNGLFLSGQLSAYHSKVNISNSIFRFAKADDSLSIKSSDSEVTTSYFYDNLSDAIDLDFNSTRVSDCRFERNGGDAVDVSGGKPYIFGNYIEESKDKGVSIGENSKAIVINNLIKNSSIGIAVKDLSEPKIINSTVINNETGISLYQKKEIFGGGKGYLANSIVWGNKKQVVFDSVSTITVEYSDIEGGFEGSQIWNDNPQLDQNFYVQNSQLKANKELLKQYCQDCQINKDLLIGIFKQ